MDAMRQFRRAVVEWAAGGAGAPAAAAVAHELAAGTAVRTVVLVEGASDRVALEALAARHGRVLDAEGIAVVPLGGATSIGRFLTLLGPQGLDVGLAGLCDAGEEGHFARALERAGLGRDLARADMEPLGFYVCVADLEEELIRSLGAACVQQVVDAQGDLRAWHIFQKQPAQRERNVEQQLRRFMGTISGRKSQYARALVDDLDLSRVPRPLDRLLAHL
ncbi:ATP-dependent endonuclease [Streptomyces sp. NPDC000151]|uniref:ATP-dependent endonuclease n=1 Tax=Streptomyces sp. NPDC000151 TaxID=3154244 RepID=UPI00331A16FD